MGEPDAYRLDHGRVIYRGNGGRWCDWTTHTPLVLAPSPATLEAATPLYLTEGLA